MSFSSKMPQHRAKRIQIWVFGVCMHMCISTLDMPMSSRVCVLYAYEHFEHAKVILGHSVYFL